MRATVCLCAFLLSGWMSLQASTEAVAGDDRAAPLWSLVPPQAAPAPDVHDTAWPRTDIDRFVLARLDDEGLAPVRDASRQALIRRAYFDLIGLPPQPAAVAEFLADDSPQAFEKVVDRLLASTHFGERWGRHWLDVVRFAESSGREFNFTYPHAWPYRDYVISAFNSDKPYDLFIQEQVAGDLLPQGEDKAAQIAAGFLAIGPKRHNQGGMQFRMEVVDDQIDTTTRAFLGLTVACARCHDHKFDPIPTADYYALAGVLLSTEPLHGTIAQKYSNHPTDVIPFGPDAEQLHAAVVAHYQQVAALTTERDEIAQRLSELEQKFGEQATGNQSVDATAPTASASEFSPTDEEVERPQEPAQQLTELKAKVEQLEADLQTLQDAAPTPPTYSVGARDRKELTDAHVALGGELSQPGELVPRGFLRAVAVDDTSEVDRSQSGRLQMAQWLSSPRNPLTARVMVNRIWHHLLGRGLVETVDNFGTLGKPPSHPQLLDNLAVQFVEENWSVKKMIRSIMISRVYCLSTTDQATNRHLDPDNRWLWRANVRPLEAESLRDAILSISGQLDRTPPQGSSVTGLGDRLVRDIPLEQLQPESNHRSVYLPVIRDYLPEVFELFDFPSPSLVSGRRAPTNVPSQALYLRNSAWTAAQAEHTARRLLTAHPTGDAKRLNLLYRLALARSPSHDERETAMEFLSTCTLHFRDEVDESNDPQLAAWTACVQAVFATVEFRYLLDDPTRGPYPIADRERSR